MQIAKGAVAAIHYRVATADGEHVDASQPGEPLVFLCGTGQIIPGLEDALIGRAAGESLAVDVAADRAYGRRDPDLDLAVPVEAFPEDARADLRAGLQFHAAHPAKQGETVVFTVLGRQGDRVMISGNHPLADKDLHFEITIDSVRAATRDEIAHGHAHGPGGHHHH